MSKQQQEQQQQHCVLRYQLCCLPSSCCGAVQMKLQEEMLAFLRQVSIFKGSGTKHLLQLQFALSKCTVQRGHIIIMENQPCAGMFFIQSGQVSILTRVATSHAAHAADTDNDPTAEEEESALHSLDSPHARRSRSKNTAGQLPGVTGKFHQVAVLGPADYVGEVVASKHLFSAVAETTCSLFWLKPQELHMLGHKALGLAMQYNELRQARWHQPQHLVQSKLMSLSDLTATEVAPMQSRQEGCFAVLCCAVISWCSVKSLAFGQTAHSPRWPQALVLPDCLIHSLKLTVS